MKKNRFLMIAALAALLVSCGGNKGGMSFGDNEYPVEAAGVSSATLQTSYVRRCQASSPAFA